MLMVAGVLIRLTACVSIGTVLHLVNGDIPSVVKTQSSTDVDPWDIPGALVDDVPDPSNGSTSSVTSFQSKQYELLGAPHHKMKKQMLRNLKNQDKLHQQMYFLNFPLLMELLNLEQRI